MEWHSKRTNSSVLPCLDCWETFSKQTWQFHFPLSSTAVLFYCAKYQVHNLGHFCERWSLSFFFVLNCSSTLDSRSMDAILSEANKRWQLNSEFGQNSFVANRVVVFFFNGKQYSLKLMNQWVTRSGWHHPYAIRLFFSEQSHSKILRYSSVSGQRSHFFFLNSPASPWQQLINDRRVYCPSLVGLQWE